jgi:hypothetical protein
MEYSDLALHDQMWDEVSKIKIHVSGGLRRNPPDPKENT